MEAEQIIRALAQMSSPTDSEFGICHFCGVEAGDNPQYHQPDCPWRLAMEWVIQADQPASAS